MDALSFVSVKRKTILIMLLFHLFMLISLSILNLSLLTPKPYTFLFWILTIIVLSLYLTTSLIDPGYWPLEPSNNFVILVEERHSINPENIVTVRDENMPTIKNENIPSIKEENHSEIIHDMSHQSLFSTINTNKDLVRICSFCKITQPYRTKHCRDCNKCVALYDHHCPWIAGCVGQNNRIYFFWYVFFQCIQLWTAWIFVIYYIVLLIF